MSFEAVVTSFDLARGDGTLCDADGRVFYFHCVGIADGSRQVDPGAAVRATRRVGLRGRDEAWDLVKL